MAFVPHGAKHAAPSGVMGLQVMRQITFILALWAFFQPAWGQTATLSGTVSEAGTGESVPSAMVLVKSSSKTWTATTNPYGFYSLSVPSGKGYTLVVSMIGYAPFTLNLGAVSTNRKVDVALREEATQLGEVEVVSERLNSNVTTTEMSVSSLTAKEIKKVPQLLGETDIIRTLTLLPGVSTVGEGASGFNVRGGNADQNLILLDEAPVYNSSHLFGFFSIFNADAVKDVKLYKGGMPANYGGRLSSVLDVRQKEGNAQKFAGTGGIGLLSSRLLLEGPIVQDKVNFMVAGRRSYFDLFFPYFNSPELDNTTIYFYDLNIKVNAKFSEKDRVFVSSYFGRDQFGASDLFDFGWGNWTSTLRWNRLISPKLFFNATAVYSDYTYQLGTPKDADPAFIWDSRIQNYVSNLGWTWYADAAHTVDFGVQNTAYVFHPGQISGVFSLELQKEYATEPALYVSDDWRITDVLTATYGLRYSTFFNVGSRDIQNYSNPENPTDLESTGLTAYGPGEIIASFTGLAGLEPRLALNYQVGPKASLKASYNRSRQYLHLISNNTTATPVNVWRPAGKFIAPATVDQVALGWAQNYGESGVRLGIEVYYKEFQDLLDYKDGADLIFTEYIETQLLRGDGRAYGAEFLLEKKTGAVTGWLGYTLSRTERIVDGGTRVTRINNGEWYPANYDKLHDLNLVANWSINRAWEVGGNFAYQSGRPITYPDSRAEFEGMYFPVYTNRNGARTPASHRLDLSATYTLGTKKPKKAWESSLAFGAYNVYGRRNPYSIFFRADFSQPTNVQAYRLSIFGSVIPYFTYNFTF